MFWDPLQWQMLAGCFNLTLVMDDEIRLNSLVDPVRREVYSVLCSTTIYYCTCRFWLELESLLVIDVNLSESFIKVLHVIVLINQFHYSQIRGSLFSLC